jgi:DNA polymerase-3 subunit epsilon
LPKNWDLPYSNNNNWPYCIQVSWVIYTRHGEKVACGNHYINDNDFKISKSAFKIHKLTSAFLLANGEPRKAVMQHLADDLIKYKPLVIGHFMDLDKHMLGADFYRAGIPNALDGLPAFCTMIATSAYVQNPNLKYLRLSELYQILFDDVQPDQHNALGDAKAGAKCFFELVKKGEINDDVITLQQKALSEEKVKNKRGGCSPFILIALLVIFLIIYWI